MRIVDCILRQIPLPNTYCPMIEKEVEEVKEVKERKGSNCPMIEKIAFYVL